MKPFFLLLLSFVTLFASANNIKTAIDNEIKNGNFRFAEELIDFELQNNAKLSEAERLYLLNQKDIMHRICIDFSKTEADILPYIQRYFLEVSPEMLQQWEESNALEMKMIDGEKHYFKNAAPNLFRIDSLARKTKKLIDGETPNKLAELLKEHLPEVMKTAEKSCTHYGKPEKMTVTYTLSVKPNQVPDGKIVRCWLPYPRTDEPRQKNVKLLDYQPKNYVVAPDSVAHKTIYFEQKAVKNQSTVFKIRFSYSSYPEYHNLTPQKVAPLTDKTDFLPFLEERKPHITFSDTLKKLSQQIVGSETNPYLQAKRIFSWIRANFPWASAREYSTIENIPQYVIENRHGDCGQVSLLFITLCRLNGIPARWQSGFMMHKGSKNLHDWAEIYLQNVGWVVVDTSFGEQTWATDDATRFFYLGGHDAFRWIVNNDFGRPLFPEKKFLRSETVDFQRGEVEWEGGNLYFDQWDYSFQIEYGK